MEHEGARWAERRKGNAGRGAAHSAFRIHVVEWLAKVYRWDAGKGMGLYGFMRDGLVGDCSVTS